MRKLYIPEGISCGSSGSMHYAVCSRLYVADTCQLLNGMNLHAWNSYTNTPTPRSTSREITTTKAWAEKCDASQHFMQQHVTEAVESYVLNGMFLLKNWVKWSGWMLEICLTIYEMRIVSLVTPPCLFFKWIFNVYFTFIWYRDVLNNIFKIGSSV